MEMFDANRISTAETDTEYAAYSSSDTINNYLSTIILSMVQIILSVAIFILFFYLCTHLSNHNFCLHLWLGKHTSIINIKFQTAIPIIEEIEN